MGLLCVQTQPYPKSYPKIPESLSGIIGYDYGYMPLHPFKNLVLMPDLLRIVGDIDEFKGSWKALGSLAPDRLATLKRIATVESVGASTRIEGARLTDREVDLLL